MTASNAEIRIKRVYDSAGPAEGMRVLVDRLWPRGLRKATAALDLWLKEIAPSTDLRQWFDHDPAKWQEFSRRYRAELKANTAAVDKMCHLLAAGPVTLLYAAHDPQHNHALVLASYLRHAAEQPRQYASPACFAHEMDDGYKEPVKR